MALWLPAALHRALLPLAHVVRHRWRRWRKVPIAGVSIIITNIAGDVLLLKHSYGPSVWALPGGGLGRGEDPEAAARREVREELGVDPGVLPSAWKAAVLSLVCFIFGALLPVIPWYIGSGNGAKAASVIIGVVAAALVGAVIGRSAEKKVWWSSLRQVLILIVACGVTYLIGSLFNVAVA